jgi:hypothetical protein
MLQSDLTISEKEAKSGQSGQRESGYNRVVKSNVFSSVRGAILDEVNHISQCSFHRMVEYIFWCGRQQILVQQVGICWGQR